MDNNQIIMYQTEDGLTKIEVTIENETVWLNQLQMAELFQRDKSTISRHIKNIFEERELDKDSVVAKIATTASDGKIYDVEYYSLDVIISVGYRVKSLRGTQFRIWANRVLKEYLIKGFAMNDELLKSSGGGDYFKELLERIRDIRSSERVFYRQILDIYATSIDYDKISVAVIDDIINSMIVTTGPYFKWKNDELYYKLNSENRIVESGFKNLVNYRELCALCQHKTFQKAK